MGLVAGEAAQGFARGFDEAIRGGMVRGRVVGAHFGMAIEADGLDVAAREALGLPPVGGVANGALAFHEGLVPRFRFLRLHAKLVMATDAEFPQVPCQEEREA